MGNEAAAQSAVRKLEKFYAGLNSEEQKVIGLIISSSLQRAARAQAERDWLKDAEVLLKVITPEFAPTVVSQLGSVVAGQMVLPKLGSKIAEKRPLK